MAQFATWYEQVKRNEGFYVNDPLDRGKETYAGVSRKSFPNWAGWAIVDAEKRRKGGSLPWNYEIDSPQLAAMVQNHAKQVFWDYFKADGIASQEVADILVDWGWASGPATAAMGVQQLLKLPADGRIGSVTLNAINKAKPQRLFEQIRTARLQLVDAIIRRHPEQQRYETGWKRRITDFPSPELKKK